jgi:hypothetical protein
LAAEGSVPSRVVWSLIAVGIAAQVVAMVVWGHTSYLWVQGAAASAAAALLLAFGLRFLRRDPRASRWPPLLPLAAISATGAAKDFCVASGVDTPAWLVALLLASVVWFLIASWLIWRAERQADVARKSNLDAKPDAAPDRGGITVSHDSSSLSRRSR